MKVRVAILGCARIAKAAMVDAAVQSGEIDVVAVASRTEHTARAFASTHGVARAYGAYEAALSDEDIDAVYIPLPNSHHGAWTQRALDAGKAVLCEKPLCANASEAEQVARAARSAGRPLMEAFHYRYHPLALFVAEVLASGELGAIRSVRARFEIPAKLVPHDDIRFELSLAGGALMDVGAYCVNAVRFATGEEPIVEKASADLVRAGIDGATRATLRFPSGAGGEIVCSLVARRFAAELEIVAERGRLTAVNPFVPHMGHRLELEIDGKRTDRQFETVSTYVHQARAFAAAVRGEAAVKTDAEDGVANMRTIDAIYRRAGLAPRAPAAGV